MFFLTLHYSLFKVHLLFLFLMRDFSSSELTTNKKCVILDLFRVELHIYCVSRKSLCLLVLALLLYDNLIGLFAISFVICRFVYHGLIISLFGIIVNPFLGYFLNLFWVDFYFKILYDIILYI